MAHLTKAARGQASPPSHVGSHKLLGHPVTLAVPLMLVQDQDKEPQENPVTLPVTLMAPQQRVSEKYSWIFVGGKIYIYLP